MEFFSQFIEEFRKICTITQGNALSEQVCRDPDDDWLLACAEESGAELIVSGDKDVTSLKKYKEIRILDAGSFLEELTWTESQPEKDWLFYFLNLLTSIAINHLLSFTETIPLKTIVSRTPADSGSTSSKRYLPK